MLELTERGSFKNRRDSHTLFNSWSWTTFTKQAQFKHARPWGRVCNSTPLQLLSKIICIYLPPWMEEKGKPLGAGLLISGWATRYCGNCKLPAQANVSSHGILEKASGPKSGIGTYTKFRGAKSGDKWKGHTTNWRQRKSKQTEMENKN